MANPEAGQGWQPPPRWQQQPTQWQPPPGQSPPPPQWPPPPSGSSKTADKTHFWFKVYAGVMTAIYACLFGAGIFLLVADLGGTASEVTGQRVNGVFATIIGLACLVLYGIGLFLPRRPWAWVYGVVLIGIGLTSCCILPAALPLLIFWLKPEMKARFNKT